MRITIKAGDVTVGAMVLPPLARIPEKVLSIFKSTAMASDMYITITTTERIWTADTNEDVVAEVPDPQEPANVSAP